MSDNFDSSSLHDLINKPPDDKPKGKRKPYHRRLFPGHILINTRLIVGMGLVTLVAIGLSVSALARPARVEPVLFPTAVNPTIDKLRVRVMPIIVTATPMEARIYPTATAVFMAPYVDISTQQVALSEDLFGYPAGTRVRITSTWLMNFDQRWYSVVTENGTPMEVLESQLMFITGTPTPAPPASRFAHLQGTGLYWAITIDPVAEIPINTKVRIDQAWFDGQQWLYTVAAEDSNLSFTAQEWELSYAPDLPPMQMT